MPVKSSTSRAPEELPVQRPLPQPTLGSAGFWTGGSDGVLRIARCADCGAYTHPPLPRCRSCRSDRVTLAAVSGRAVVAGFTVNHQQWLADFPPPYVIAVVALEEDAELARAAREALADRTNVEVVSGSLAAGCTASAPFDVIVVEGATEIVPETLLRQLSDGGRLLCVLGGDAAAKAMLYLRSGGDVGGRAVFDAAAPVLPGFTRPLAFAF